MLSLANIDVTETLGWFRSKGLKVSFLVPTETGLQKSIMDATLDLRNFLSSNNLHNFDDQNQGIENKKLIETILISENSFHQTQTSLYRPQTKNGDPRLWVYELGKFSKSGDLLAFLISDSKLIVINCSNSKLDELERPLIDNIKVLSFVSSPVSDELLQKIQHISSKGFIKSMRSGDTGVGFTLESLLGITANSSKNPDYKGIEIKSSRKRNNKGTLLSMVPNWKLSNISSADELVMKRGRENSKWGGLKTLNHTIKGDAPNNWGLKLDVDHQNIHQSFISNETLEYDVCWVIEDLGERLSKKHRETFWVEVDTRGEKGNEEFHYKKILHTGDIDTSIIPTLIQNGIISVDYLLWERGEGWKNYTSKTGFDFLWKIQNKNKNLLFKFNKTYEL